jgi:phosphate starvation-inducible PhoH-like protein
LSEREDQRFVALMSEQTVSVADAASLLSLFGARDQHLRKIRDALAVSISARDHEIHITGEEKAVAQAVEVMEQLKSYAERYGTPGAEDVERALAIVRHGAAPPEAPLIDVFHPSRKVRPRTPGQIRYVQSIRDYELTLAEGPAGTGKTYLAVATAVSALKQEQIRKIVLVRPAVEAGESLGFLPGDLHAKINPYLRPLLDALTEMLDYDQLKRYMESDVVEVIPLAYMRGRTLNEAFIILDEAQNTTVPQMKMFLTRMGRGSKIVVSGDTTQVDLPSHTPNGLTDALHRLRNIEGIARVQLTGADIVRHRLVQEILRAYDEEPKKPR